jgi:CheY-like chemotaxis protein
MRNLFAMSKILSEKGMNVLKAEDGEKALALLDAHPEIALVLLDIMMPVMDGYQTARQIRSQPRFHDLPIIALTAKALKDDRDKCIEAGANDYLAKPVDVDRLFSTLRVWLYRQTCVL